jgi:phosphotriesterase-related protein
MNKKVTTVLGDIPAGALGFCQSHEHLYLAKGKSFEVSPVLCIDDPAKSTQELLAYRTAGGGAVVDAQPVGCGRDAERLKDISRESGIHIIASTGFHKLDFYPEDHWIFTYSPDKLALLYIEELKSGMYGDCDTREPSPEIKTHIRAGQIKTALDACGLTKDYQKLFSAAAAAARETGAPLMAHIEAGADPIGLADYLCGEGVDLKRVIFCHMDRATPDLSVHAEMCRRGITLEYDTIAREKYHSNARETEITLHMLAQGSENQLLMGLDVTRARLRCYGGAPGLDYSLREFLPALKRAGVTETTLEKIFVTNPARVFAR